MRSQDCDEEDNVTKQEIEQHQHHNQNTLNLNHMLHHHHHHQQHQHQASSSRQWTSAFRNPRIVRVSRAFGGKDRHSKVCTIRGLRDRRIRLSVPTAIQLYDLQDRLGLNQPSKVIDWLLEESKEDINNLPPLQFPQGFNQMYPNLNFGESSSSFHHGNNNLGFLESFDLGGESSRTRSRNDPQRENFDLGGEFSRTRSRNDIQRESFDLEKGKWVKLDDQEQGFDNSNQENFEFSNQSNKLYDHTPMNSHYNLGHLQHSLEQSGNVTIALMSSRSNVSNQNLNLESPAATGDGSQLFFGPPVTSTMSSLFPTYPSYLGASHLQLFSSNSASQQHMEMTGNSNLIRPFHHLMNSNNETDNQSSDNDSNS